MYVPIVMSLICLGGAWADIRHLQSPFGPPLKPFVPSKPFEPPFKPFVPLKPVEPPVKPFVPETPDRHVEQCQDVTSYVSITSTQVVPFTVYDSKTQYISTTVNLVITSTSSIYETFYNTQTVTQHKLPQIITNTQSVTAVKYQTQIKYLTETSFITETETQYLTATEVAETFVTRTVSVPGYATLTTTFIVSTPTDTTTHLTQTSTRYYYVTENVPQYVTRTVLSTYLVYDTVTSTETRTRPVTDTTYHLSTFYTTLCTHDHHHTGYAEPEPGYLPPPLPPPSTSTYHDSYAGY